jgi:hypothetical protein
VVASTLSIEHTANALLDRWTARLLHRRCCALHSARFSASVRPRG